MAKKTPAKKPVRKPVRKKKLAAPRKRARAGAGVLAKTATQRKIVPRKPIKIVAITKPAEQAAEKPMKYRCKYCGQTILFHSKAQKKKWVKSGFVCPHCQTDMCCLPPTERDLMKLQKEFFERERPQEVMGAMYKILKSYAQSIILKKHLYQVDPKDLGYHAHMSAWYLVEHYYNNPDFRIKFSFGAYLSSTVYQAVYHKPKGDDRTVSLDIENDESKKVYELQSSTDLDREVQHRVDPELMLTHLDRIVESAADLTDNSADDEFRLHAILMFLKHGQSAVDRFFQHYHRRGKISYEDTMRIVREELHRMHRGD